MIRFLACIFLLYCFTTGCSQPGKKIVMGDEQIADIARKLQGKRVGLLVNHTAMVGKTHLADTLLAVHVNVVKLFAPEHGVRGKADAGEWVADAKDEETGLPVVSLYTKTHKPTPEQLSDVDVVVFDIQDVGTRFYTYLGSMTYMMEACAEQGKKMMVLDRPNPNGSYVDGPVLKPEFKSFIGMHPVPVVHGMTVGEYAQMINGQGWLKDGLKCELEVISMKNYSHNLPFSVPVKPSPNLPNDHAIALYPSICFFEGTALSLGRGTQFPFEVLGSPELKDQPFQFTPVSIEGMAKTPPHENKVCYGIDLRNEPVEKRVSLKHLIHFYQIYPDKENFFLKFFTLLAGNTELKEQIISGMSEDQIRATWQKDLDTYKKMRTQYLLYP